MEYETSCVGGALGTESQKEASEPLLQAKNVGNSFLRCVQLGSIRTGSLVALELIHTSNSEESVVCVFGTISYEKSSEPIHSLFEEFVEPT